MFVLDENHQLDCFLIQIIFSYHSFIALILEKVARELKDFCPISLLSSIYKIILRWCLLGLRHWWTILSQKQKVLFWTGVRSWMVFWWLMNVWMIYKKGWGGGFCKLDLEKAYDHVSWDFLEYMLDGMGFGRKWWSWMKACFRSVSLLILVNGLLEGYFLLREAILSLPSCSLWWPRLLVGWFSRLVRDIC